MPRYVTSKGTIAHATALNALIRFRKNDGHKLSETEMNADCRAALKEALWNGDMNDLIHSSIGVRVKPNL